MTREYKAFMTHAKKLTRKAPKDRTILKDVHHKEDGSLAVTDTHRLYVMKNGHEKKEEVIIDPIKNSEVEGNYPDIEKFFPLTTTILNEKIDVEEWIKITELFKLTKRLRGNEDSIMILTENKLKDKSVNPEEVVNLIYDLEGTLPEVDFRLASNAEYWNDALRMFKASRIQEVVLKIYDPKIPFVLESEDGKIKALILPVIEGR